MQATTMNSNMPQLRSLIPVELNKSYYSVTEDVIHNMTGEERMGGV